VIAARDAMPIAISATFINAPLASPAGELLTITSELSNAIHNCKEKFGIVRALTDNQEIKTTGNPMTGAMRICPGKFAPIRARFGDYFGGQDKLDPVSP
jgi:hypothetical protein